jgi:hypothetical protein
MAVTLDHLSEEEKSLASRCVEWARSTGLWNGRPITQLEAPERAEEMLSRLADSIDHLESIEHLKPIGLFHLSPSQRLQSMGYFPEAISIEAGLCKSSKSFWQKYKTPILIAAAAAVIVTVVVVTGGMSAGAAAAALPLAAPSDDDKPAKKPASPSSSLQFHEKSISLGENTYSHHEIIQQTTPLEPLPTFNPPPQSFQKPNQPQAPDFSVKTEPSIKPSAPTYQQKQEVSNWNWINSQMGQANPFKSPSEPTPQPSSWRDSWFMKKVSDTLNYFTTPSTSPARKAPEPSQLIRLPGTKTANCMITGINGIDNTYEDALGSAKYLQQLACGHELRFLYNSTNGPIVDVAETALNFCGATFNAGELIKEWTDFHIAQKDNPKAKCLHICHSQGGAITKAALLKVPEEVRNRVMVIAIAPASVITKNLCFRAVNYASKHDIVPHMETVIATLGCGDSEEQFEHLKKR